MAASKVTGLHTHRFKDNPEEERFAKAWEQFDGANLDYLLQPARDDDPGSPPAATDRERVVAATVVQWLGSPVGQGFLRDLGYEKKT